MKRLNKIWLVIGVLAICSGNLFATGGDMGNGSGTEADPYLIEDFNDFNAFASDPNYWAAGVYTQLTVDIDLDPNLTGRQIYTTAVIAKDVNDIEYGFQGTPFEGVFDGNDYKIYNLTIDTNNVGNDYLGLFGQISSGEVMALGLENVYVAGGDNSDYLGGLCGVNYDSTISNCYSEGSVTGGVDSWRFGGLCGQNYHGTISNCYSEGSVTGGVHSWRLGGLCGQNYHGTISNCYSEGSVTGGVNSRRFGGLCGENYHGTVSNCYSEGSVTGGDESRQLGGLCGYSWDGTISYCYATGSVTGGDYSEDLGGLCGWNSAIVYHSFWDMDTSEITSSAGGVGKTTAEMMDINTYAGWGDNVWTIDNGNDYPHLAWENQPGVPIIDSPRTYSGGSGDPNDPYLIAELNDLITLGIYSADCDKHFKLSNNIDLSAFVFDTRIVPEFRGVFDGDGYQILNLTINTADVNEHYLGLFGKIISEQAQVKNLGLDSVSITGGAYSSNVGGLCGWNEGIISYCYATGSVTGGDVSDELGGLCGNNGGTISQCYATGTATGEYVVGGLCGMNQGGVMTNCYAIGSVTGYMNLGGLCGLNNDDGTISNCYATGSVTGEVCSESLGGLCGQNRVGTISHCYATSSVTGGDFSDNLGGLCGHNRGPISNCYATGSVTGGDGSYMLGGLCGWNRHGTISNCYSTSLVSGTSDVGGLCGWNSEDSISNCYFLDTAGPDNGLGIPLTDTQMKQQASFVPWDFVIETVNGSEDIWTIKEGLKYPEHVWPLVRYYDWDGVDFKDYAFFSSHWMMTNCNDVNDCNSTDFDFSGTVGINDLNIFCSYWLEGTEPQ